MTYTVSKYQTVLCLFPSLLLLSLPRTLQMNKLRLESIMNCNSKVNSIVRVLQVDVQNNNNNKEI